MNTYRCDENHQRNEHRGASGEPEGSGNDNPSYGVNDHEVRVQYDGGNRSTNGKANRPINQ